MTSIQINEAKKTLPPLSQWQNWTKEQKRLYEDLSCRQMIISCIIYGESGFYDKETDTFSGRYAEDYLKTLGEKTVRRLWNEQKETMSKAVIHYGAQTDAEGCVYATVTWQ